MRNKINNILIIGHKGAMGNYFFNKFKSIKNIEVRGIDRPLDGSKIRANSRDINMVLFCIPVQAMEEVIPQVVCHLRPNTIIVDICSVKVIPMKTMLRHYPGPVIGTHPLFGPNPDPDFPLKIAMVRGRGEVEFNMVKEFFNSLGFLTFDCSAREHDQAMAFIQGLNFVTTLSYVAAVSEDETLVKFITPSFERRLKAAKKMITQDAYLFQTLFETNPYSHNAVKRFRSFLNLASAGELDLLIQKAWWWWEKGLKWEDGA